MTLEHPQERRRRGQVARGIIALLLGGLVLAFFRVQVLGSSTWTLQSDSNRLRPIPVWAPRGTLFDRDGAVLAESVPGYEITLLPAHPDTMRATLETLRPWLELSPARVETLMRTVQRYPRTPLLVDADADFRAVAALRERPRRFPGVYIEMRPKRHYPLGPAAAHALGYVGEINPEELEDSLFSGYEPRTIIGKEGLEREYERLLQGNAGLRYMEVDAAGRIVGSFAGYQETPAVPGADVTLNLDAALTRWIHRIFPDTMKGAVVALDVEDGGVLALYSAPSFDPNLFVGGIRTEDWRTLNQDPNRPLFNRPVLGLYPPASTWKLASAAIGLELGVVTPDEHLPVPCTGAFRYGSRVYRCWDREGHGSLDLAGALANSCDVYFYQLGLRVSLRRLLDESVRLGFTSRCGIDHPHESEGIFPEDFDYWRRVWGYSPREGEVLSLAIGQGANSQTPLKMAQFYVAIARGGQAPAPRLRREDAEAAPTSWTLDLAPESLAALQQGLWEVMQPGGTGYLSSLEHWDTWGKSGTGQNPAGADHAWFALMAGPREGEPEIVVVVLVEHGESGSQAAAPIAAKTADFHLRRKYDIPVDTVVQTLRDHYWHGVPAPWAQRAGPG